MNGGCVYLVDDQPAVLKGLGRLLAAAGVASRSFDSAQAFLDSGLEDAPGCVVLDLSMPGMDGMALQQVLQARRSSLEVIFLTGHGDIDSGVRAMKLGAADFLTKPVDGERLLAAVRAAVARNAEARRQLVEWTGLQERVNSLTPREREVMELVVEGLLNKQIADVLGTVEKTVKVHRARVMSKMQAGSVSALVRQVDRLRNGAKGGLA